MSQVQWPDLKELLADALELDPADRPHHLDSVCGDNVELRQQLEELLSYENGDESLQQAPMTPAASPSSQEHQTEDMLSGAAPERWIGPYRLLELIGEGGMGYVFKAEQVHPVQRHVAIKLIKPGCDSDEVIARFQSERQALARMDHPGIAKVFDAGVDDRGRPYFVMEHVAGIPITRFADEHKLTLSQRLELFTQVCDAIAHAHTKAIIHRDIKPSNILACVVDGRPFAKVIDFGIAKAVTGDRLTDHTFATSHGQPIGTYEAMSPEQAACNPDIDTRTDVYSLGVLLYQLLSGIKPFDRSAFPDSGDHDIRHIIQEVEPGRPSERLSSCGPDGEKFAAARGLELHALKRQLRLELEWIPLMAMRKEPGRRYPGVLDLCADVRSYLESRPLVAGPESSIYRIRKFVNRNSRSVLTAALVFIVIALAVGSYIRVDRRERRSTQTALELIQRKHEEVQRQRNEAQRQAQIVAGVNWFLGDMLTSADPDRLLGDNVTVLQATEAAVKQLDGGVMREQPLIEASVRLTVGNTLHKLARLEEAERNLRRSLQIRREALPANHPEIADSLDALGVLLRSERKFVEAEEIHREALALRRQIFPAGDPAIAVSLSNLASVLQGQERVWDAEVLYREALAIRRKVLPPGPLLAESLDSLAVILADQKQFAAAETLSREALEMREEFLPAGHPGIAESLQTLAVVLRKQGDLDAAEPLFQRALTIYQNTLTANHPEIITSLLSLAKVLKQQGKDADAQLLFGQAEEALAIAVATARRTPQTSGAKLADYLHLLAEVRQAQNKFQEAEDLLHEALEINRHALPIDHLNISRSLSELGIFLWSQGKPKEAEALFRESLTMARAGLAPADPALLKNLALLVRVLPKRGEQKEATLLVSEALEIARKSLPAYHPQLASILGTLARLANETGDAASAEEMLLEAIDILRHAFPNGDRYTALRLGELAKLVWQQGRLAEAELLLREAVAIDRKVLEADSVAAANDIARLGMILYNRGDLKEAELLLREALPIQLSNLGPSAMPTVDSAKQLSIILSETGRSEEAVEIRKLAGPRKRRPKP